jgi:hypothetical protein
MKVLKMAVLAVSIIGCLSIAKGQKNSLRLNTFNLAQSQLKLSYERLLNDEKLGLNISPILTLKGNNEAIKGIGGEIALRSYILSSKKDSAKIKGKVFAGIGFEMNYLEVTSSYYNDYYYEYDVYYQTYEDKTDYFNNYQLSVTMGYQMVIHNKIALEWLVGAGLKDNDRGDSYNNSVYYGSYSSQSNSPFQVGYVGIVPKLGFNLGFVF